ITYPQAVLGGEAKVNTLIDGEANLNIPAGTKHGQILRLKGKGMPQLNRKDSRGDLYAHVFIDVPDKAKLSEKQKELITQLAGEMDAPVSNGDDEPGLFDKFKNLFK
ncbi:MAG: J domain-containing protein, partial [Synergistaceae bacterium]|nr:J domain-containing protein [Synergistaceae bacterium]